MSPWLQLSQLLHLHRQAPDWAAVERGARRQVPPAGQQAGVQGLQQAHRHHPDQWQEGEEEVGTYCTGILQCPQPFSS